MPTKFFTNDSGNNLFDKFKGIFEHMPNIYAFHALVGYFRSSGYFAIRPYLEQVSKVRILVGINVDHMFAEAQRKGLLFFGDEQKTRDEFMNWITEDIKEAKYSREVEDGILQFIHDLIEGKIEVRAHKTRTLHAKIYIFLPEKHNEHSDGWVITGSSNLTDAGLGTIASPNYEFNVALKDFDDVHYANSEFERLWAEGTEILPADLEKVKAKSHLGQTFTPFEIYVKFLIEYFGKNIDYDPDTVGDLPKQFKKLSYQIDAVNQGFQMLMEHNGFFLADVVGLGKTVIASIIAKRFMIANGSLNTKILVVYPPALEKNWKTTFRQFGLDKHTRFITNGRLEKILKGNDLNYWPKEDYDLILVDEAHKYRNHKSLMFQQLQRICKAPRNNIGQVEGQRKKVILISATPLNNRPQDIYYLIQLFQDARRSTLPINNLTSFFGPLIKEYKEIMSAEVADMDRVKNIYTQIRKEVIEPITVRRTRRDIEKFPQYKEDLDNQGIKFPEIAPPRGFTYQMGTQLEKQFYNTIFHLTEDSQIGFYRYQAIRYLKPEIMELYYEQAQLVSIALAGIMKTLMVKRLESSFHAFRISLGKFRLATERMIVMFEKGKIFIAPDDDVNAMMDAGLSDEAIEDKINQLAEENPRNRTFSPEDFQPEFIEGLKHDHSILVKLEKDWLRYVDLDPKLDLLLEHLGKDLLNSDLNPGHKLILFTESKDTSEYLYRKLYENGYTRCLEVSSENRNKVFDTILENFDANYVGTPKNDIDILITTDVLAEGINLHRSNVLVNYDTPWNATRLMQRVGRINRIGSVAPVVYNYHFYPSRQGDEEIKLYKNALVKLQAFHSAFGEDTQIFTEEELVEQFRLFKDGLPDDEDKRLIYLRFIREFKDNNPAEFKRIAKLPMKARTGRDATAIKGMNLKDTSVLFVRSKFKTEFYAVLNKIVKPLTFLEAVEYFKADPTEPARALQDSHYSHIQAALHEFEQDFLGSDDSARVSGEGLDQITKSSRKFLRDLKGLISNESFKIICDAMIPILEEGVITQLGPELNKLRKQYDKRTLSLGQVENLITKLAAKYELVAKDDIDELNESSGDGLFDPKVILSESFI